MNILKGMTVFAEVVNQQGFAPAARALNLSTSAVSRHVFELESWLGVQLLQRTTRKLSLTEEGAMYLDRCNQVIADVDDIKNAALHRRAEPQGPLKLTAPVFIAKECLQELLPGYLNTYPKVSVELTAVDRFVDLVEEGFDLALRAGDLADSTLVARRLMDTKLVLVASPAYLASNGTPKTAVELKAHNCLIDTVSGYGDRWPVGGRSNSRTTVQGNVRANSGETVKALALAGLGIALLPHFMVMKELHKGHLTSFLDEHIQLSAGLYAVYPQQRFVSANVRTFIDYLITHLDQLEIRYGVP
ncbi:MAG: LysR substrate-binding domain-containing protein [Candidatus Thiodiazotropha endolucinida]